MKQISENINYNKFEKIEHEKAKFVVDDCQFSFVSKLSDEDSVNYNTIISVINQNFVNFEWLIFGSKEQLKVIKNILNENKIKDDRIKLLEKSELNKIEQIAKSDYLVNIYFGVYLDNTFLETIYVNLTIDDSVDVIYTNVVNTVEKKQYRDSIISKNTKTIDVFTSVLCFRKSIFNDISKNILSNKKILHLDYYGVFEEKNVNNKVAIKKEFKNYPKSCLYNFDSEPQDINFKYNCIKKEKNILCFMPWAKIGGADLFNLNVMKYLKTKGYSITIVTTEYCIYEARELFEEVADDFYDLPSFLPREYWSNFIDSLITNKKIELIFQMNSLYTYHLIPWIKCKYPKLPIIDYLHAEDFSWRNGGYPKDSTAVQQFLDKTFTCNNHLKDLLIEKMSRNPKNLETLYIGVDTEKFNPENIDISDIETLEFCKDKKVILFPSRFSLEKRPLFLLNLMKRIKEERTDIVCLMVGDGDLKKPMKDYIQKNNLDSVVRLVPMQKDVRQYYKLADITMICSLSEGITLTTYESLAMNTPVITADVGGQKEVVNESCGAVIQRFQDVKKDLYNYNYSMEEIELYKKAVYDLLIKTEKDIKCREVVLNKFSQEKMLKEIEDTISSLIKKGSSLKENITFDEPFAIRYLVLFNEFSKAIYNNSFEFAEFKEALNRKILSHKSLKILSIAGKKIKLDKIIKKIYFGGK